MSKVEEDCVICYEKLENVSPLLCGHVIHISCVKKHFKPECPLCRKPLNIEVNGTRPDFYIPDARTDMKENIHNSEIELSEKISDEEDETEVIYSDEEEQRWRKRGFNYPEEDEEWDEENPFGDDYNYGSY